MSTLEAHLRRQTEHSRDFFWHRLRWRAVASHLPRSRAFQLLDVGAGAGLLGVFLKRDFPLASYRFLEPIESLQRQLESAYGAAANAAQLRSYENIPYVALLDVLEHQADDRRFLRELLRKMVEGSILIVTVPAMMGLWSGWDVALGHHRRYDRRSLRRVIEGLPVEVIELSFLFPEMIPLALLRRWLRKASSNGPISDESAAFPDLPLVVNNGLYAVGSVLLAVRRQVPAGSSLLAVLRKT
jgi:methyltransferase family protein